MQDKLISVIVPVYKVEKFLKKCVESIVNQTYHNLEIILVDDGSPDACPKMCDDFAKKDSRITVIHKKNGGLSDARNYGLDVYKGDYVFFVDSDDYLPKEAIYDLYKAIERENADIAIGDYIVDLYKENRYVLEQKRKTTFSGKVIKNQNLYESFTHKLIENNKFDMGLIIACNKLYKRQFLIEHNMRFKKGMIKEDLFFNLLAYSFNPTLVFVDSFIYRYYVNFYRTSLSKVNNIKLEYVEYSDNFYRTYYPQLNENNWIDTHYYNNCKDVYITIKKQKCSKEIKENKIAEIYSDRFFDVLKKLSKTKEDFIFESEILRKERKNKEIRLFIKLAIRKRLERLHILK